MNTQQFRAMALGARDSLPLVLAAIPFGLVFGLVAHNLELSTLTTLAMSALVFAGSAQFIALGLMASAAAPSLILLTVFVVNLRHLLYAASLMPVVKQLPQRWRIPMAFSLTDETYAAVTRRLNQCRQDETLHWYYLGSALLMYSNWLLSTLAGLTMGQQVPELVHWGLDVAMVIGFIAIVVPLLNNSTEWLCAGTAFFTALLTYDWPHQTGLLASTLFAIGIALTANQLAARLNPGSRSS